MEPVPPRDNYAEEGDYLIIEDESGRAKLAGNIDVGNLVTGVVIAVLGKEDANGDFIVEEHCFAGIPDVAECVSLPNMKQRDNALVAIVSGLNIGGSQSDSMSLNLLGEFLNCNLGSLADQQKEGDICRVIIAGNSISHASNKNSLVGFLWLYFLFLILILNGMFVMYRILMQVETKKPPQV